MSTPALNNSSVTCFAQGTQGDLTRCVVDGMFGAGPSPALIGLIMAGTLVTSLYVAGDGSIVVPSIVTVLLGSVLVPLLPPQYVSMAYTVVVIGGTLAAFAAYQRFTTRGGF